MGKGRPSPLRLRKRRRSASQRPIRRRFLRRSPGGGAWRRGVVCACAAKRKGTRAAEGRPRGRAGSAVCVMPRVGSPAKAMAVQKTRSASAAYQRVPGGTHGRAGSATPRATYNCRRLRGPPGRAESAVGLGCAQRVPGGTHGCAGNEVAMRAIGRPHGRQEAPPEGPTSAQEARPRVRRTTAVACEGLPAYRKRGRPRLRATRSGRNPRAAGNEVAMRAIALAFCERPAGRRKCFRLRLRTNAFRENLPGVQEARPRVRRTTAVACEGLPACRKRGRRACPAFQRGKRRGAAPPGPQTFRAAAKQQSAALCRIAEGGASDFKCPFRRSRRFAVRRARR